MLKHPGQDIIITQDGSQEQHIQSHSLKLVGIKIGMSDPAVTEFA